MRNKFFYGVVIFFLITFFMFFFRLFRPFVGVVVQPVSQTMAITVQKPAVVEAVELINSVDVNVEANI